MFKTGTANAHYRAILPLAELQRRGHEIVWPSDHAIADELRGTPDWDLLHVQQFVSPEDLAAIMRLRQQGVAVVWDTDDDVLAAPKGSDPYKALGRRRGVKRAFRQTVGIASASSLMTTPSEHLAQIYRDAGVAHVACIENHLWTADVGQPRRRHAGIVIGLTAASEHTSDIEKLGIVQALRAILQEHEGVRVVAIGCDLKLGGHRYSHRATVPIDRLVACESEFDIGLAPLVDTAFNRARSNIKLKEYGAAGATWLASPVGPYRGMGEPEGGQLVDDRGWYEAIEGLIVDYRRRGELARRARAWARTQTIQQAGAQWETAFKAAVGRARGHSASRRERTGRGAG